MAQLVSRGKHTLAQKYKSFGLCISTQNDSKLTAYAEVRSYRRFMGERLPFLNPLCHHQQRPLWLSICHTYINVNPVSLTPTSTASHDNDEHSDVGRHRPTMVSAKMTKFTSCTDEQHRARAPIVAYHKLELDTRSGLIKNNSFIQNRLQ